VLTPRDITTNTHGNFVVDSLTFDFTDEDGEECTESWDRSDGVPLREHLDEIVDIHFGGASEEVRARGRENIQQVSHPITAVQCYHQYDLISFSLSPSF